MSCWDCEHLWDTASGRFYCGILEEEIDPDDFNPCTPEEDDI